MKKTIDFSGVIRFLVTQGQSQFDDVLESIERSSRLAVASHSIPTFMSNDRISRLSENAQLELVTAMPGWNDAEGWRESLKTRLTDNRIDWSPVRPESVSIHFNASNHLKLLLTDETVYVGSANFSYGSRQNFEPGGCVFDRELSDQIYREFFCPLMLASQQFSGVSLEFEYRLWQIQQVAEKLNDSLEDAFDDDSLITLRRLFFGSSRNRVRARKTAAIPV